MLSRRRSFATPRKTDQPLRPAATKDRPQRQNYHSQSHALSLRLSPTVLALQPFERIPPPLALRRAKSRAPEQWSGADSQAATSALKRAPPTLAVVDAAGATGNRASPTGRFPASTVGLTPGAAAAGNGAGNGNGNGAGSRGAGRLNGLPSGLFSNPLPLYPPELLARGIEGLVLLHVWIGEDGSVQAVKIHASSGQPAMDDSALRTGARPVAIRSRSPGRLRRALRRAAADSLSPPAGRVRIGGFSEAVA